MAKEKVVHRRLVPLYSLEKYTGKNSRHECPNCGKPFSFARFVNVTTGEYVADDVGRCNRETECGYIKSPKDANNQDLMVPEAKVKKEYRQSELTSLIDSKFLAQSLIDNNNNFSTYLYRNFDKQKVDLILRRYMVGTGDLWEGSTVFWQVDKEWDVRTGKIMLYNPETLKRVKTPFNHISWVHSPRKDSKYGELVDFNLTQCFFGEHLLNYDNFTTFAFVESEKTAILCSIIQPTIAWIATGGLQNIGLDRLTPFKDKDLVFYPDKGKAYHEWCKKLEKFKENFNITVNSSLEKIDSLKEGDDMADYLIKKFVK